MVQLKRCTLYLPTVREFLHLFGSRLSYSRPRTREKLCLQASLKTFTYLECLMWPNKKLLTNLAVCKCRRSRSCKSYSRGNVISKCSDGHYNSFHLTFSYKFSSFQILFSFSQCTSMTFHLFWACLMMYSKHFYWAMTMFSQFLSFVMIYVHTPFDVLRKISDKRYYRIRENMRKLITYRN